MSDPDDDDLEVLHEDVDLVDGDEELEILEDDPDNDEELLSEPEPERKKPLSRAQKEIIKLRQQRQDSDERARRAEEKADRAIGAVDVLSRQPNNSAELERQEKERLESMTDSEKVQYLLGKERTQLQGAFAQQNFQMVDRLDKADFKQLCRENPAVAEVAQEVEDRLAKLRRETGTSVEREIMADKILGERVRMKAVKNLDRARARNEEKTRQHMAKAPGARSDVAGERTTKRANMTARERLEAQEAKGINPFRSR